MPKDDSSVADTKSAPAETTTTAMVIPTTVVTQADVTDHTADTVELKDEKTKDATVDVPKEGEKDKQADVDKKKEAPKKDTIKPDSQPSTSSSQPIFKPLTSDKGKSKSSGRTIGGWL